MKLDQKQSLTMMIITLILFMATKSVSKWSPSLKTVIPGSSNVNVVLIRGLNTNWKHIIYYDFRNCINRETLDTIIVRIQTTGQNNCGSDRVHYTALNCEIKNY